MRLLECGRRQIVAQLTSPELAARGEGAANSGELPPTSAATSQAHEKCLVVSLTGRPDLQARSIYHEARVAAEQLIELALEGRVCIATRQLCLLVLKLALRLGGKPLIQRRIRTLQPAGRALIIICLFVCGV